MRSPNIYFASFLMVSPLEACLTENSSQTREIATADYVLENYRWFKSQSAAIEQVRACHKINIPIMAINKLVLF